MNNCIFMGRLTSDPEIRMTTTGMPVANFNLAIYAGKDKTGADKPTLYPKFTAFNASAEYINEHYKKGDKIIVECRYTVEKYRSQDIDREKHSFIVSRTELAERYTPKDQSDLFEQAPTRIPEHDMPKTPPKESDFDWDNPVPEQSSNSEETVPF